MDSLILGVISFFTFGLVIMSFIKVYSCYQKYKKIDSKNNLSGCEIAEKILSKNNLENVYVVEVKGELIDHFSSARNVIRLSTHAFHHSSIAAIVIAAHECALAIKNKKKSFLLNMRGILQPTINIITYISYIGLILAIIYRSFRYLELTVGILFIIVLYHLLTFKLESVASKRATLELKKLQLVKKSELEDIEEMSSSLKYIYLASPIILVINLFNKINIK